MFDTINEDIEKPRITGIAMIVTVNIFFSTKAVEKSLKKTKKQKNFFHRNSFIIKFFVLENPKRKRRRFGFQFKIPPSVSNLSFNNKFQTFVISK